MTIGEAIKSARQKRGMTQRELATGMKVTPSLVAQYESGVKVPKLETIRKIASALGVDPYSLMDFDMATHALELDMANKTMDQLRMEAAFHQLNTRGQKVAADRVEELTEIPKYKKEDDPA